VFAFATGADTQALFLPGDCPGGQFDSLHGSVPQFPRRMLDAGELDFAGAPFPSPADRLTLRSAPGFCVGGITRLASDSDDCDAAWDVASALVFEPAPTGPFDICPAAASGALAGGVTTPETSDELIEGLVCG
jgi:hypothetical protein